MITIHELGHYLAGKILKFKINEFAIGMGPKVFSKKKKNGEIFSVRAVPLGGFCAFAGEDDADQPKKANDSPYDAKTVDVFEEEIARHPVPIAAQTAEKAKKKGIVGFAGALSGTAGGELAGVNSELKNFNDQKPWKRIIVLMSGGLFNLISAVLFSFIFIWAVGLPQPQVAAFAVDEYGNYYTPHVVEGNMLELGDIITHADGKSMDLDYMFSGVIADGKAQEVTLTVIKNNGKKEQIRLRRQQVAIPATDINGNILRDKDGKIKYSEVKDKNGKVTHKTVIDADGNVIYKVVLDENGNIITKLVVDGDGNEKYRLVTDEIRRDNNGNLIYKYLVVNGDWKDEEGKTVAKDGDLHFIYESKFGLSFSTHYSGGFVTAIKRSVPLTGKMSWLVLSTLGKLLTGQMSCTAVSGPVGTIAGIAEGAAMGGWRFILIMLPLIAANLGVFNLLPIPALDGSKIIFSIIEWIRKKPINRKVENMIHAIGLLVLLGLVILVDITGMFARCGF